jgi:hypothetical protein
MQQATRAVRWAQQFVATIREEISHGMDNPDTC